MTDFNVKFMFMQFDLVVSFRNLAVMYVRYVEYGLYAKFFSS